MLRLLAALALLLALSADASAQPARLLDINPSGSDFVASSGLSTFITYTPRNVDLTPRDRQRFTLFRGELYFAANDGVNGQELWRTNGTPSGTELAADLAPGAASSLFTHPVPFKGALYFTASPSGTNTDRGLYRFDGFEAQRVSDRDLLPVGATRSGLFLQDRDTGEGFVLGSCNPDGSGGPICAFEEFLDDQGNELSAPVAVGQGNADYFSLGGVMYRTLLTPETTTDVYRDQRTGTTSNTQNVIGAVGRPYSVDGQLLFVCFFSRERQTPTTPGDVQGAELCASQGGFNDVRLVEDLVPGERSPDLSPIGVYNDRLYASGRIPGDLANFAIYRASSTGWRRVSQSTLDTDGLSDANDVFMLEARGSVGYFVERARTDDPFPPRELALFRGDDGSRVSGEVTDWQTLRTAGERGDGYFVARAGITSNPSFLYQWDGANTIAELGEVPFAVTLRAYADGVVMAAGGELWTHGTFALRTIRQILSGTGTVTFAVSLGGDALPFTLDVSALGTPGQVQVAILDAEDAPLASLPATATAVLDRYYSVNASADLTGLQADATLSYTDADLRARGIDEATLDVWKTDDEGGWILLPIVSRDASANTVTVGPVDGFSDFVIGTQTPVSVDGLPDADAFALSDPAPNPARGRTSVTLAMAHAGNVRVSVVDALGREVAVMHDGRLAAGRHRVALDAADLAAGVYAVRAEASGTVRSTRMVVVR